MIRTCLLLLLLSFSSPIFAKGLQVEGSAQRWVERTLDNLSLREKVAQLFIGEVRPLEGQEEQARVEKLVQEERIGGLIWMSGAPLKQVEWIDRCQLLSHTPMLMTQDLEWGLAMRMPGQLSFPRAMALGKTGDIELIEEVAAEIGRQARHVGIHMIWAPVADVATNRANPVIGVRAFGEEAAWVAKAATAYWHGLQKVEMLGCAKHFPGHGDTLADSHLVLPVVVGSEKELWERELLPFRSLIEQGIPAIMMGHLALVKVAGAAEEPATLSREIIQGWLRDRLGFTGVVVTDALDMAAVQGKKPGEVELAALKAGNDILLMSPHIPESIDRIMEAVQSGELSVERIEESVTRVLQLKAMAGLYLGQGTVEPLRMSSLRTPAALDLQARAYKRTVQTHGVLEESDIAVVEWQGSGCSRFSRSLGVSALPFEDREEVASKKGYWVALYSEDEAHIRPLQAWISTAREEGKEVGAALFGSPYLLDQLPDVDAVLFAYDESEPAQRAAADLLLRKEE